jgi:hypothetical protein
MMMNQRISKLVAATMSLAIMGIALLATPASVNGQREDEIFRKKLDALMKEVARLQDEGVVERAEQLAKKVQELKARLTKVKETPRKKSGGEQGEILGGLKAGAASLRALGRIDEAEKLERLAAEIQKKAAIAQKRAQRFKNEREVALGQFKIMRAAMQGLLDADRKDLAAMIEHTIHAEELAVEGVRNAKAAKVRETAPTLGQRVELLNFAARKLREAGKKEQASAVGNLAEQLMVRLRAQQKRGHEDQQLEGGQKREGQEREGQKREGQKKGHRESEKKELEIAAVQIEVMQTAMVALREGERRDAADILNRAIQARMVRLRSLTGKEAEYVLEREPKREQTIEVLGLASKLWREFGNQKNTAAVRNLAEKLTARRSGNEKERAQKERAQKEKSQQERAQKQQVAKQPGPDQRAKRLRSAESRAEQLQTQNAELFQQFNQLNEEVDKLKAALEKIRGDLKQRKQSFIRRSCGS